MKLIPVPGLGRGVSAMYAATSTYALGMVIAEYFRRVHAGEKSIRFSRLPSTLVFTAIRHFDFRDGNLGMRLSGKAAAGWLDQQVARKGRS
ncbi:MAG: hypothetical protein ACLP9L_38150 [Thermoguttaceae bacterium]